MRVVTYARVSTDRQEEEGQSLVNQERAFARWLERSGATRIRAYREAASAGTVDGRLEFARMIRELPETKPDAIVVDTLDRFTRDATDGLVLLRQLRGHGVGLLPLDWRRERPINVDDDRDWQDVYDEFGAAERERRRIRRRVIRSYEGRRERGATTHNKVPLGVRKVGDRLEPSDDAWLIREIDTKLLTGVSMAQTLKWLRTAHPRAWKSQSSLHRAMRNDAYVAAGIRTPETHAAIGAILERTAKRFGEVLKRRWEHEFTGVFRCGYCGYTMHSVVIRGREQVVCERRLEHPSFYVKIDERVTMPWQAKISSLTANVDRWAAFEDVNVITRRHELQRQLAHMDQRAAALKRRRDRAWELLEDDEPAIVSQARRVLTECEGQERELQLVLATISGELDALGEAPRRDPEALRHALTGFAAVYRRAGLADRNKANRLLVAAVGSQPTLRRDGKTIAMDWPAIDALRTSAASSPRGRVAARARTTSLRDGP